MRVDLNFKCPQCGETVLEEVLTDVVQSTVVESLESQGGDAFACNYGETDHSTDDCDGIYSFRCKGCGFTLCHDSRETNHPGGDFITSEGELFDWLAVNGMLSHEHPFDLLGRLTAQTNQRYSLVQNGPERWQLQLDSGEGNEPVTEFMSVADMKVHMYQLIRQSVSQG
jgi:hypothetical protein